MELGDVRSNFAKTFTNQSARIESVKKEVENRNASMITTAINHATQMIQGGLGGHVVMKPNANGQPEEILIMDTDNIATAVNVIRLNKNGIAFSRNGYNGTYRTGWTIDGNFVADFITTGTLNANLIKTGTMSADRILGGTFKLGGSANGNGVLEIYNSSGTRVGRWDKDALYIGNIAGSGTANLSRANTIIDTDGRLVTKNADISGKITSTNADISGKITSTNADISGKITATSGQIGGFHITSTKNTGTTANGGHAYTTSLYGHSGDGTYEYESGLKSDANSQTSGSEYLTFYIARITKGSTWANKTIQFSVNNSGYIYSVAGGKLGAWTLGSGTSGALSNGKKSYDDTANNGVWIGPEGISLGKGTFRVSNTGAVRAKSFTADDYIKVDGSSGSYIKIPSNYGAVSIDKYSFIFKKDSLNAVRIGFDVPTGSTGLFVGAVSNTGDIDIYKSYARIEKGGIDLSERGVGSMALRPYALILSGGYASTRIENEDSTIAGNLTITKNFTVSGTKRRSVHTYDYGERLLYCYETPSPLFGDVGEGKIGDDGKCYVQIDSVFAQTVSLTQYQVFLQKYGDGECWIKERKGSYFVVEGTPGLIFGWEIKAKQVDFDQYRLERFEKPFEKKEESINYSQELMDHISRIKRNREVSA